ncbi:uncharacterized protein LOC130669025 [Microplitis mediator]|uniref:uncharacterized protein LOC130669025 n=1 Tax=Microplitis mediator TaxID=375433 RepID=UPI002555C9CC|nr:uncharacterized protein LOC130669025 [Microplitis mediator]
MNSKIQFFVPLCVLLILITSSSVSGELNPEALIKVAEYAWKAIEAIIGKYSEMENNKFQQDVIDALDEIRESTARIESLITDEADRIIKELSVVINMKKVNDFVDTVFEINQRFEKKFLKYFTGNDTYQNETIENYINATINPSDFGKTLSLIRKYTVPNHYIPNVEDKRVFEILHDYIKIKENHVRDCNEGASGYDLLFAVFNLAITALSKGYTMVAHAYRYRQLHCTDPNAWKPELRDALDDYKETVLLIAEVARASAERESKAIRRCDPKPNEFIEGENYDSYQFLTTFVTDPYMLEHKDDYIHKIGPHGRTAAFCDGSIYDCITDTSIYSACLAPVNSKRRYNYVTEVGGNGVVYYKGRVTPDCKGDDGLARNIMDGRSYFERCLCQEPLFKEKGAHFNMTPQFSDFNNNRVITGIRLVSKLSITYFVVQEGRLVNGSIDNTTVKWNDAVTKKLEYYKERNLLPSYTTEDLYALSYSYRSIDMDDINLPAGWVAVGVKFKLLPNHHLSFEVAGMKIFDELGNRVISREIHWFGSTDYNRSELPTSDLDIPTMSKKVNRELSESGKNYVKFKMSGWWVDVSQTLYPYIDLQKVTTKPPAPIGGVGLCYKGQSGFGGFIAPKIISMNNTIFMSKEHLNYVFNSSTSTYLNSNAEHFHVVQVY